MKYLPFLLVLLVGCAAAPKKEVKLSLEPDEGSAYAEPEPKREKHPLIPQSYATKSRNGVANEKDALKKQREKEKLEPIDLGE